MKESICDRCEEFFGLGRFGQHWFASKVTGRGDQRSAETVQDQFVQGTVGQQCAEFAKTRRKCLRQGAVGAEWDKYDGSFRAEQTAPGFSVDRAM
jgi:hypothetical protein